VQSTCRSHSNALFRVEIISEPCEDIAHRTELADRDEYQLNTSVPVSYRKIVVSFFSFWSSE
jgi:hypothetical protein